ncbi:uncharacterized protein L969DRAFT_21194 [Mixia osmundae IAM 14324]|uniref:Histone-lysine N-methyltransferase SET5 n=1 Tax=Mixia osmundae (strain CBS 9802 / IAM 14324 / JCM 22182 / KY 12970) TaxID=764103 RepID=G7EAF0_MIXOS|nr:uncharacterized protein L969DRAFT_21194 [Mixia osmundae IAM 14324]KEI42300.1 hypothetical protein L969DRAFT_21194 [Mixia osmundae IAM 14324]GAA99810.1 hypothetical protein E5Q_06513 [Mixia osmundae IAM 14324]
MTDKPDDGAILDALEHARSLSAPGTGVTKLYERVKANHPQWQLSDKRFRKLAAKSNREAEESPANGHASSSKRTIDTSAVPVSKIDPKVVASSSVFDAIKIRQIDPIKGKGIVAARDLPDETQLLHDTAYVFAAGAAIAQKVQRGQACAFCGKLVDALARLAVSCQEHPTYGKSSKAVTFEACKLRYCDRVCSSKSRHEFGQLICPALNDNYRTLLAYSDSRQTSVPLAVFKLLAKTFVAYQRSEQEGRDEAKRVEAFAGISQRVLCERQSGRKATEDHLIPMLKESHVLTVRALHFSVESQASEAEIKPDEIHWKTKFPASVLQLLSFDSFLLYTGKVNLNREDDGGVYALHSSLNHSCHPNASVRRVALRGSTNDAKPSKVYIITRRPIKAGEEITLTYCSPHLSLEQRREYLYNHYLFECWCERCVAEMEDRRENGIKVAQPTGFEPPINGETHQASGDHADGDLADEIKAALQIA